MFSKNRGDNESPSAPTRPTRGGRAAPSIVSADVVVVGNVTSGGDVQIDGTIEGDVKSVSLTIGDKATINGEIVAEEVIVRGRVIGSIRARRVQLCSTSHVEGNILHEALAVETGAYFEGNCRHSPDPISEEMRPVRISENRAPAIFENKKPNGKTGAILGGGLPGTNKPTVESNLTAPLNERRP